MADVTPDSAETRGLLERAERGEAAAVEALLGRHRPGLLSFVELHLDPRLRARVDASDVVQEVQLEAVRRMDDFLSRKPMPFRLWLRKTAYERLLNLRRDHVGRQKRSVRRESALPDRSSVLLARPLLARGPSPSQQAEARELEERISRAVAGLSEQDREILLMRHAEDLPFDEIACLLEVDAAAARKRFGRALIRLQQALAAQGLME
jgi:RNA polymerase sigma-70 factor (ECF subfamily)